MGSCSSCCFRCLQCSSCFMLMVILFVVGLICWMPSQINVWLDKSMCIPSAGKDCFCPHFNNFDYDSLFVGFDICLTSTSTINLQHYQPYLEYSNQLTRQDISIGSYETYNITIDPDDFDLFDRNPTKKCINKGSCKKNDIYAHVIVYDYPSYDNKQRNYINHYTMKMTKHDFKEVVQKNKNGDIFTKLKHSIHIENKINISYVTEHGCFDKDYWGNKHLLWPKILKREYENKEQYVPIVTVHYQMSQITISKKSPVNLTLSFNPQSIFGFQIQNLLRMDQKTATTDASKHAPELMFSFQLCKSFVWVFALYGVDFNALTSKDQLDEQFNMVRIMMVFMATTTILGLLALMYDYKYWTKSTLTMRNICCAAILVHFVTPLLIGQRSAYDTYTGEIMAISDNNATQMTFEQQMEQYLDVQKQYDEYLQTLAPGELFGFVFGGILSMFVGLVGCAVYVLFPMAKAVKCFKLKKEEGVDNDIVALFEVIIVIVICGIVGYDYEIMQYFLKYVGMGIFIPQIIINCCLDNDQMTPKLPLVVYACLILDGTFASMMNYNIDDKFEITMYDVMFWCRDTLVLMILFVQHKCNSVQTERAHLKSE